MSGEDQAPDTPLPDDETSQAAGTDEDSLLKEQLEEALREKDQFRAMAQRAQADLINYRKRTAEELQESKRSVNSELLLKTLSIVDDLERAASLIPKEAVAPGWRDGLDLVLKNLHALLVSEGVTRIDAVGRPFEPWEHEAVLYEETSEAEEGEIVRIMRQGYRHRDRVLRAAQVVVAKKSQTEGPPETTEEESQ